MAHALKIAFMASEVASAQTALDSLSRRYGSVPLESADVIVALGGDGFMLQTLHGTMHLDVPVYGMNRGTVGFLMNSYAEDDLAERRGLRRRSCGYRWMARFGCRSWSVTGLWWRRLRDRRLTTIRRTGRFCRSGRMCSL